MKWLKPGGYYMYRQFNIQQFYVSSQIHTKHVNTLCWKNVVLLSIKPGGTYSDHWAVKG